MPPQDRGHFQRILKKLGFEVFPGDIERKNIQYRNGRCIQLDLNKPLPLKDGTFDYVTCVAGIEHLENPHHLIKEFSRLIKRKGFFGHYNPKCDGHKIEVEVFYFIATLIFLNILGLFHRR